MQLNDEQMDWLNKLGHTARKQRSQNTVNAKKTAILDKFHEQREKNMDTILDGMKIKVARVGKNGKVEEQDVWREDLDQTKTFDIDEQRQGWRVAKQGGKGIEGEETEEWQNGQELIEQPEFAKFSKARHLLIQMTDEAHGAKKTTVHRDGKKTEKPLFTDEELTAELYDPLVRRGVPETFIGNDFSRTQKMTKGSFKEYAKRLEKEDVKGFVAENKDLGIAFFRMGVSLPGNVMGGMEATKLATSQQQTTSDINPVKGFEQAFGMQKNDSGSWADNLEKASQAWAFLQNVSDISFDGIKDTVETGKEVRELGKGEKEGPKKPTRKSAAPMMTQAVIASVALTVGGALAKLGPAGSTIFASLIDKNKIARTFANPDTKEANITEIITDIGNAIEATLLKLCPRGVDDKPLRDAVAEAKTELGKIDAAKILQSIEDGDFEDVIPAFNLGAQNASKGITTKLGTFVTDNAAKMKALASEHVTKALQEKPTEEDKEHKKKFPDHDPDWVEVNGKQVCLRCQKDTKDVNLFAGIIQQKIIQLKKEEAYFKMAVNLGGMAFDVAANFLAPLGMGGALLRMAQHLFKAVKRYTDFHNFCKDKTAMINAASSYSAAIRRFRDDSFSQGMHYSINAACEGAKIVAACLQCTPAAIGGIVTAQVASGVEAVEAFLWEVKKRVDLEIAWKTYKQALNHPENRKMQLITMRKNPTLAKYAVAWGAVIDEDPLVSDFISHCGLNADTIEGDGNIDKVVDYLEARMPDDIVVVGRKLGVTSDWAPTKVELTVDSWIDAKTRGETKGNVKKTNTSSIESAFTNYANAKDKLTNAKKQKAKEAKKGEVVECLDKLRQSLQRYFPRDANHDGEVTEMTEVVELFFSKIEIEIAAIKA